MANTASQDEVFHMLYAHAQQLWGEAYAEHKRAAILQTAEEMVTVEQYSIPPDLEPRFF